MTEEIYVYLNPSISQALGDFSIPAIHPPKKKRGLECLIATRFLMPRHLLTDFEKDPHKYAIGTPLWASTHTFCFSFITKFQGDDPEHYLMAEDWPTFLYDEQAGWSPQNIRHGLFRGHVLARVSILPKCNHFQWVNQEKVALRIYRSKTAARADTEEMGALYQPKRKRPGPKDLLTKAKLTTVTPYMVAYAAVQVLHTAHRLLTLTMAHF